MKIIKGPTMHFKTIFLATTFLILSAQANEDKKELFNDKYLNSQKLDQYRDTNINTSTDFKISNIKEITKISDDLNKSTSTMIDNSLKSDALKNKAHEIDNNVKSKVFQNKIIENENYLLYDKKINWQQHLGQYKNRTNVALEQLKEKGTVSSELSTNQFLESNEKLFIVISSSIPKHIIKNYFEMLQNVNTDVTFVLRGTIGGVKKIKPTLDWMQEVLTKSDNTRYEYNVVIEPRIVNKYKIERLPAVLYVKNYNPSYTEESTDEKHYIYYGTVDIDYALGKINGDVKSLGIGNILSKI
jgi:type-F conjugative transfer system pilin assembly protein TrbC